MHILLKNGKVLLADGEGFVVRQADIAIENDTILAVGEIPADFVPERVLQLENRLVIPGLINAHTHAYMTILRGVADDVPFEDWLFRGVMPKEDAMSPEDAYWSALLGLMEMVKSGATCFHDMQMHIHQTTKAAVDLGMRGVIGRGLSGTSTDEGGARRLREAREEIAAWKDQPLLTFDIAPHAPYTCEGAYLQQAADLAEELGLGLHIHLCESANEVENCRRDHGGLSPIQYVDSLGCFRRPTVAAHCVHITQEDIRILAKRGVSVATCPASNMKLGNGFAPLTALQEAGVNLCLGTDGAASNNGLNMFREMGLVSLVHKGAQKSSVAVTAADTLRMATAGGAKALGLSGLTGEIAPGRKADLAVLRLDCPQLTPANDLVSSLVYSANGSEVETVIINGEMVLENRHFTRIDEEKVLFEAGKRAEW